MRQSDIHGIKRFIRPVSYGAAAGMAACVLLLLALAAIMSMQDVPQLAVDMLAMLIFLVGGFVSGLVCSGFTREKGLLLGVCCGAVMFLILTAATFILGQPGFGMAAVTKLAAVLCAAAIGGIIGVNRRKKV